MSLTLPGRSQSDQAIWREFVKSTRKFRLGSTIRKIFLGEFGEKQFGCPVDFFHMWITGEDEGLDGEVNTFLHPFGTGIGITYQRCCPQVRANFEMYPCVPT